MNRQQSTSKTKLTPSSPEANNDHKSAIKDHNFDHPLLSKVEHQSVQPGKITYSVVHAIPGRIRFHVPRVASDRAYARRLERLLKTEPQVTSVHINSNAASVAITYKIGEITAKEQLTVETESLWSDLKSPPLSAALSFMVNFPLDPVPD